MVHGYMNNSNDDVRSAIATSINNKFGTFKEKNIIMTVGAAVVFILKY